MHPKYLSINEFNYNLPEDRIAKYPLPNRDESKLLLYRNGNISEDIYFNLSEYIPNNSLLIFNDTKVVEARLVFTKPSGVAIEIFCLEPSDEYPDITTAMLQNEVVRWKCFIGGAKKWKDSQVLAKPFLHGQKLVILSAEKKEILSDSFLIEFSWADDTLSFAEVLHLAGLIPLPPYIKRDAEISDKERYQTVYAKHDGSVAAPTAGLHFTEKLLQKIFEKNIHKNFVTLHVGAGTFKPVKSEIIEGHEMHAEFIDVNKKLIEDLIKHKDEKIIVVGTTSLRTIESLFWMGIKTIKNKNVSLADMLVSQWEPYDNADQFVTKTDALTSLIDWMNHYRLEKIITKTQIIIAPGYSLKIADGLITNFHQPQSTLLLLIAAITGNNWKIIYDYAMNNNFRFLSYGDGSLIWK